MYSRDADTGALTHVETIKDASNSGAATDLTLLTGLVISEDGKEKADTKANDKQDGAPAKPKYVFKIAPADPKNAFDFEDVADK